MEEVQAKQHQNREDYGGTQANNSVEQSNKVDRPALFHQIKVDRYPIQKPQEGTHQKCDGD
jgi:hypothetical protein